MTLKNILDEQGRRNGWVAARLGVSPATVTLWCQGKREIPDHRVRQLAQLLGVPEESIRGELQDAPSITERQRQPSNKAVA